jgi:hypothetical protein
MDTFTLGSIGLIALTIATIAMGGFCIWLYKQ